MVKKKSAASQQMFKPNGKSLNNQSYGGTILMKQMFDFEVFPNWWCCVIGKYPEDDDIPESIKNDFIVYQVMIRYTYRYITKR